MGASVGWCSQPERRRLIDELDNSIGQVES